LGGGFRRRRGANFALAERRIRLALLLRNYEWELASGQNLRYVMLPFLRLRSGFQVRFRRISPARDML